MLSDHEEREIKKKVARLESALHAALCELQTAPAVKAAGGGSAPLLAPAIRDRTRLRDTGQAFTVENEDGLTLPQIVEQLRRDPAFTLAFDQPAKSAATPAARSAGAAGGANDERLSPVERLKAYHRNVRISVDQARDPIAYRKAKEAAAAAGGALEIDGAANGPRLPGGA